MFTVVEVLERTRQFLERRGVPHPRRDAERLLGHALGMQRLQLYVQFDRPLTMAEQQTLRQMVLRRGRREPLGWITGRVGFHEIELTVGEGVLVPRPDTETLVEAALALIPQDSPCFVADVGTGSGAVGLALAHARPQARVFAIDKSRAALDCARANVAALGLGDRVALLAGELLQPVPSRRSLDIVVSNPPYIASGELEGLEPEVSRFEPRLALDGGPDGLAVIRPLLAAAARRARRAVLIEVGAGQAGAVVEICRGLGLERMAVHRDLGGHERVVEAHVG